MTREDIDRFLSENEDIASSIKSIAEKYKLSDFIKVEENCRAYFVNNEKLGANTLYGCIYEEREGYLWIGIDSAKQRLTNQYMSLIHDILRENGIDKVFYIVAYHYLTLCKQYGYQLTESNDAPFPFIGDKISPLGKRTYENYKKMIDDRLYGLFPYLSEKDLYYYHRVYPGCGYHHHATKHFSLIEDMLGSRYAVGSYEFDDEFERKLELFIFKYKAIYTTECLSVYMTKEAKEKVIKSLVDIETDEE